MARFWVVLFAMIIGFQSVSHSAGLFPGRDLLPNIMTMPVMPTITDDDEQLLPPRRLKTPIVRPRRDTRGYFINTTSAEVADVPEEFACPMFENKSYESILESLEKLNAAVASVVKCPNGPDKDSVTQNTNRIQEAIKVLTPYFENPDTAYGQMDQIKEAVGGAVQGLDAITQTVFNPTFANTPCGKDFYQKGGIATTVSNLVNSLGPYALLGISLAPGLGLAIKTGALAIIAGSTAYSEYQKMVFDRSLNPAIPEHWQAIVQNTCAFSRVHRKLTYIQRYESGLIQEPEKAVPENVLPKQDRTLPGEIQKKIVLFNNKYGQRQDLLGQYIMVSNSDKLRFERLSTILRESKKGIEDAVAQIGGIAKANPDLLCNKGMELAEQAKNKDEFPSALMNSISIIEGYGDLVDMRTFSSLNRTYERLTSNLQKVNSQQLDKDAVVEDCASRSKSLFEILNRTVAAYEKALRAVQAARENALSKNPDYRRWKTEYTELENQKRMGAQLRTITTNISNSSEILKGFLDMRLTNLKQSLLGPSGYLSSNPPVYMWLDYTMGLHQDRLQRFRTNLSALTSSIYVLKSRELSGSGKPTVMDNAKLREAYLASIDLNSLDLKYFNLNDPASQIEHKNVCDRLLKTWDSWNAAVTYLDSIGLFCEMIDPLLDSSIDKNIVRFCRGSSQDVNSGYGNDVSQIAVAVKQITTPSLNSQRSLEETALMIPEKVRAMKCEIPIAEPSPEIKNPNQQQQQRQQQRQKP